MDRAGFDLTFQKWFVSFPSENNYKTDLKCCPPWLRDNEMFHSRSPKTVFNGISYLFILWNNLFVSCTRIFLWKNDSMKELCKNHLKIFLIKLCGILHGCRRDHFCFYKYFTNQTFTFIKSKVVYFENHLVIKYFTLKKQSSYCR